MTLYIRGLSSLSKLTKPFCGITSLQQLRCLIIKPKEITALPPETYEEKNERLKRPMSPHVTIYKMQFQSYTSIGHRITGMMMYGYVFLLAAGSFLPQTWEDIIDNIEDLKIGHGIIFLVKFIIASPLAYHFSCGIRHLVWDATGKFLTMPEVFKTGYVAIAFAFLFTSYLALLAL
ncbi:succinate dehydrogenase cytochrome b560 subunit, mitochondrial-like [Lycorma delicatula]|uniref:succinate dehydrogenase cytochrome b560 subunit, mitochondrial-like n=1 Tax=Lycorma delicatula TaxID=130591 RepID=UPI003F51268D